MSMFFGRTTDPTLAQLESIGVSHYCEKVRWCMDRSGLVPYQECMRPAIMGAILRGVSVPRLTLPDGTVLGTSNEIMDLLLQRAAAVTDPTEKERVAFLADSPEATEWAKTFDVFGRDVQKYVYAHVLEDHDLTMHVWGMNDTSLSSFDRTVQWLMSPLLKLAIRKNFRLDDPANIEKSRKRMEDTFAKVEKALEDGRPSLIEGATRSYVDYQFAAMAYIFPPISVDLFAGGKSKGCYAEQERMPAAVFEQTRLWREQFPAAFAFAVRLYEEERM